MRLEILGKAERPTGGQPPLVGIFRDPFQVSVPGEHGRGGFGAPGRDTRIAVGRIAHQREPVGDGAGRNAVLLDHPVFVIHDVPAAVPTHHPRP